MKKNKVLIGITTKNRVVILQKAIDLALRQNYVDKEISVFDDNSDDDTGKLKDVFPQVSWTFSKVNRGLVYARRHLIENTDAEYYCSVDDDSWFMDDDCLTHAVDYMNQNENIAVLAFNIFTSDSPNGNLETNKINCTNNFIGCGHLLRVSHVRKVGNYPRNPGFYGAEEKDLCIRLIDAGYDIVNFPSVKVWHDKTPFARDLKKQHRSGVCNDLVFMWRRTPLLLLFPSFFKKIYVNATFPFRKKMPYLFIPFLLGSKDFFLSLITFKVKREPVSYKGLSKYIKLSKK